MNQAVFAVILTFVVCSEGGATNRVRHEREALPQEIFRESVEPAKGGKVPEAAHMRVELNRIDSAGLDNVEAIRMEQEMSVESPELPDQAPEGLLVDSRDKYNPGFTPALKLKPDYHPPKQTYNPEPAFVPEPVYVPQPKPAYASQPKPAYNPEPEYKPLSEPAHIAPVGPVLLENRPYQAKSVGSLPITVTDTVTTFDCRTKPYPGRHYADPEAGCEIYHFCHEDGKQDTFTCSEGTIFDEYLGTCDFKSKVHCTSGEGYIPQHASKPAPYQPAPYQPAPYQPAPYQPAPYQPAASNQQHDLAYKQPTPAYHQPAYHKPEPTYHQPAQAYKPTLTYQEPAYNKPEPFTSFGRK